MTAIFNLIRIICMPMVRLLLKGGYGEHGRSCFLVEYRLHHYVMLDCGIMDTDSNPLPQLSKDEISKTDYLIISHGHKDHCGAIGYVVDNGFSGKIITSVQTRDICGLNHKDIVVLNACGGTMEVDGLTITYGRSGHCPGSFWFYLAMDDDALFYSGDYQPNPLLYAIDQPKGLHANIAIVDMAHDSTNLNALALRMSLVETIDSLLKAKRKVILPVQTYGRGYEMLYLLYQKFPNIPIFIDQRFVNALDNMLTHMEWIKADLVEPFLKASETCRLTAVEDAQLFLIADTHFENQTNQKLVETLTDQGAMLIVTGRRKNGSYCARLLDQGKAIRCLYPHHSSRKDTQDLVASNRFDMVLPFHCSVKEVWN